MLNCTSCIIMDYIFTCNNIYLSLYYRYLLTQGTLYHKGFSYLIKSITKSEYILCSTLCLGDVLYFLISIKGLILVLYRISCHNIICYA